ncbi:MAG: hypothetical protein WKF36_10500 [Candidatus Nitrosocosmicus sp.]
MVKNWDIAVVTIGMIFGFAIVLMNFTGLWPCNIIQSLNKSPFTDYVNSNELLSNLTGYVNSNELLSNTIGDIHYWSTHLFRCS